jgi:SpoVK/Ycf46/Vps4 family AAA+-type ATPase
MMTLREISKLVPFASVRDMEQAARFHVWHRRLGVGEPADDQAVEALERGRGFCVVGASGSGKTSTLAAAALGADEVSVRHIPLRLSVTGAQAAEHANDARFLAGQLVRVISMVSGEAEKLVDDAAASGTATGAAVIWRAQAGAKALNVSREVRQRTENVDFERAPTEVLETATSAVRTMTEAGLRPVILLEDADGLLRLPDKDEDERRAIAGAFFADGLAPLLRDVAVPALLAVQPEYRGLDGFEAVMPFLDAMVDLPNPPELSEAGVRLLLGESLRTAGVDRSLAALFADEALAVVVHSRYRIATIRELLEVCDRSLRQAISANRTVIEEADVAYALTQ